MVRLILFVVLVYVALPAQAQQQTLEQRLARLEQKIDRLAARIERLEGKIELLLKRMGEQPGDDDRLVAFESNLQAALAALRAGKYEIVRHHLAMCNQLLPGEKVVTTLLSVAAWTRENPTSHIVQLIDAGRYLMGQQHPVLVRAGVAQFGKQLHATWVAERANATLAAKADAAYAKEDWLAAHRLYEQIGRDSPFRAATRLRVQKVRTNIAQQLVEEGGEAFSRGEADLALKKFAEASKFAGPGMQNKILNLEQEVRRNVQYARLLAHAREAFRSGALEACVERCAKISMASRYYAEASKLRLTAQRMLTERTATKLYNLGQGPRAIKLLSGHPELRPLRVKIQQVIALHEKADRLYQARDYEQANVLWKALQALETNPQNWYVIEAARKTRG